MIENLRDNAATIGLLGGALTSIGLVLTVVALASVRTAIRRYVTGGKRFLFAWRVPMDDEVEEIPAPVARPPSGDADEETVPARLARIEEMLDRHSHLETERRLMEVAEADRSARTELLRALDDMDRAAAGSSRYMAAGLALALIGAALQSLALLL